MMQASREDDHAYTEIADAIIAKSIQPKQDLEDFAPAFENEQMRIAETLLR